MKDCCESFVWFDSILIQLFSRFSQTQFFIIPFRWPKVQYLIEWIASNKNRNKNVKKIIYFCGETIECTIRSYDSNAILHSSINFYVAYIFKWTPMNCVHRSLHLMFTAAAMKFSHNSICHRYTTYKYDCDVVLHIRPHRERYLNFITGKLKSNVVYFIHFVYMIFS